MKQPVAASLCALLAALPLAAAAQVIELDEIVISANRTPTELARTGVSVSVVTGEDLEEAGDTHLAAYLARLPGISATTTGPMGSTTNLRIRGADRRYIAVYIDGIRVTDPTMTETAFEFGALSTADIGRIEVLRGSQSALYGGSAVGGVINITTRAAMEDGFHQSAAIEAGSFGAVSGRYTLSNRTERSETAFTLSHLRSDGFSAAEGGTEDDGIEATRLSFSTRYRLTDSVTVGGAAFAQRARQEFDGFDPMTFMLTDMDNVQWRREAGARLFAEIESGNTLHVFDTTAYRVRRDFDEEGALSRFTGSRLTFGYQGTTELSPVLTLVYGADTMQERARYTALPGGGERTRISGAFAQALWAPRADLDISASARVDHNSAFGSFTTGRLAAAWRPDDSLTLRAAVATGFRAPSLDERFGNYPGAFPFVGNPNLTPEESRSFELGIEKRFAGGAAISATAFALRIDNLITFAPGAPSTLENLPGASQRQGIELAASAPLGERLALGASYTYLNAKRPDGARLGLTPRHDLTLTLDAALTDRLRAAVSAQRLAGRLDGFSAGPMPDFTVVNASVAYDLGRGAEAYLRVENLFDKQYQLSDGYATSDRAFYVGLRARF